MVVHSEVYGCTCRSLEAEVDGMSGEGEERVKGSFLSVTSTTGEGGTI